MVTLDSRVSRRSMLKATAAAGGVSAMSHALAHASTGRAGFNINRNQDKGEVVVYNWYADWIDAILPMFQEETGIKATSYGTYSSNDEWWAKLNAGETWDVFMPTTNWVERAMKADLFTALDPARITILDNLEADWRKKAEYIKDVNTYAIPFTRVIYSLTYNTDTFSEAPTSWSTTWDEQYTGKVTMQDDALARVGTTALYLGDDPMNPTKWDEIRDELIKQKELVSKYWKDYQQGMEMFVNGEVVVGQLTDGRSRQAKTEGGKVGWTVPTEGALVEVDTFAVPKSAKNVENAYAFINYAYRPEIMQMEMEMMGYDTVNAKAHALLKPEVEATFKLPQGAELTLTRDLPSDVRQQIDELWTEVQLS